MKIIELFEASWSADDLAKAIVAAQKQHAVEYGPTEVSISSDEVVFNVENQKVGRLLKVQLKKFSSKSTYENDAFHFYLSRALDAQELISVKAQLK